MFFQNSQSNINASHYETSIMFPSSAVAYLFLLLGPDQRAVAAPLFEAQLDLKIPDMVFAPSLEFGAGDGFFELVESLINDVFQISSLVPRLAHDSPFPHYQVLML